MKKIISGPIVSAAFFILFSVGAGEVKKVIIDADDEVCISNGTKGNLAQTGELLVSGGAQTAQAGYKSYLSFKLPDDFGLVKKAKISFTVSKSSDFNHAFNIYGINNTVIADKKHISWENAPLNNPRRIKEPLAFKHSEDLVPLGTAKLKSKDFFSPDDFVKVGDQGEFSSKKLLIFLNHAKGKVLFAFSGQDSFNGVSDSINGDTMLRYEQKDSENSYGFASNANKKYPGAKLELEYVPLADMTEKERQEKADTFDRFYSKQKDAIPYWCLNKNNEFDLGSGGKAADWESIGTEKDGIQTGREEGFSVSIAGYGGEKASGCVIREKSGQRYDMGDDPEAGLKQENLPLAKDMKTLALIAYAFVRGNAENPSVKIIFSDENKKELSEKTCLFIDNIEAGHWLTMFELVDIPENSKFVSLKLLAGNGKGITNFDRVTLSKYNRETAEKAKRAWDDWLGKRKRFPTLGWSFFNSIKYEEPKYNNYANVRFSLVKCPPEEDDIKAAKAAGLELLITHYPDIDVELAKPEAKDEAVAGYFMKDEPHLRCDMVSLGAAAEKVYNYPGRNDIIPIVNLWSGNRYDEAAAFQYPPFIIATCYNILENNKTMPRVYDYFDRLRKFSLKHGFDFFSWVLVTKHESGVSFRQASEADVYWQAYTGLAYGAKGIWYYNYFNKYMSSIPLESEKTQPETVNYVKAVNDELDAVWHIIKQLRSTGVWHVHKEKEPENIIAAARKDGSFPKNVELYEDGKVDVFKHFQGDYFLIGEFRNVKDKNDNDTYIILQNKRHGQNMKKDDPAMLAEAYFELAEPGKACEYFCVKTRNWKPVNPLNGQRSAYRVSFFGGQGILFRFR